MKDKTSIQKNSSETNVHEEENSRQKDKVQHQQNLNVDRHLVKRAAKRSNYHNDGPGGGYDGL
ncbi:MAG TPA: hypothetical protein VGO09_11175 [Flavisolibacter sp.]|nr:hypothetical protein [Flavisolibacter sp.]